LQHQSDPDGALFWETGEGFGPELGLAAHLARSLPEEVAILKFAIGGSSLQRDWLPRTAGTLYPELRRAVRQALSALRRSGHAPRLAGVFRIQGEADALQAEAAANYGQNLGAPIGRLRREFGPPRLPFVFARLPAGLAVPYAPEVGSWRCRSSATPRPSRTRTSRSSSRTPWAHRWSAARPRA
jgi:hypothetical protein